MSKIEEVTRYKTTDGITHHTMERAESAQRKLDLSNVLLLATGLDYQKPLYEGAKSWAESLACSIVDGNMPDEKITLAILGVLDDC
jgi:hypothetical protein